MSYESQVFYWPCFTDLRASEWQCLPISYGKCEGLINVCKDLVDHPPETLHLCCVILILSIKFSLNLCSPSNDLLKLSKYYWKWLRVLFNMDYIFFSASDVRTYVTYGPNKLALWCFHNKYHKLSSPAWIAGRHFEMRIQTSGSTNLWIWAHSVQGDLWRPWMRNKRHFFNSLCIKAKSVFPKV